MYVLSIVLLLLIFPAASVAIDAFAFHGGGDLMWLVGKWFTFWACGVRLFMAGVRQNLQPDFTAKEIFRVNDPGALPIVREVGFGNLSIGLTALVSLILPAWLIPAAFVGGLYYGLAGLGHAMNKECNAKEQVALWSDVLIFLLLAVFVVSRLVR
ncbi:MAG: DUF6790 family protein [Hyphomicrobium sp.]